VGDRHLKFHETRDNLAVPPRARYGAYDDADHAAGEPSPGTALGSGYY
jgi:hypothetical protein